MPTPTKPPKAKASHRKRPAVRKPGINPDAIYSVPEAASLMGVSETSVWRYLAAGQIGSFAIGIRRRGIGGRHVLAFLARGEQEAAAY